MKKLFTLAAAGSLAVASLSAQAQVITINGTLGATETSGAATAGKYVLLGQYPYAHNFGPWGLLSMYGANTASKVQIFLGGTLQASATNSLQLYMHLPSGTGVPSGTALPGATQATSTSLDKFTAKLDQGAELAIALHSLNPTVATNPAYQIEAAAYYVMTPAAGTTPAVYAAQDTVIAPITSTGTVVTVGRISTKSRFAGLSGARFSYMAPSGDITTNPGYTAPQTTTVTSYPVAGFGQTAGTTGWEMELDRTSLGLPTGNPSLSLFAVQNNGGGDYASGDFLPNAVASGANLGASGASPDFTNNTTFPGTQSATFALATVTLATRVSASSMNLGVYPNPVRGASTVTYEVADRATNVNIVLTDLMGRTVRTIENGLKPVGAQTASVDASSLAAGTYLMRVQVGDNVSTSKVSVL
ncbi:T9SS type A sorting domain-containing protein [Hymenobacter baengnokdamensis]|uniref:T9SS type A sorting domain-containing protein n=1 Tax=Hymenobacter baengnokdamensis TaxID=2615203 RepID=UPI0012457D28|nr:T9SS type A sorting domain-containing protein [Hymenobacter baengnokdamensis]